MFNWFKKKEAPKRVVLKEQVSVEHEASVKPETPAKPELSVADYPFDQYKVYWETHLYEHPDGPFIAEVRFHGVGTDHLSIHKAHGLSFEDAEKKAFKLIKEKMEDYKWR